MKLRELLEEVTAGVGERWADFPLIGATRSGIAPAKEAIGKNPERYKLVMPGTIFYNPMRILLGSIAMVDEGEPPGITSPDYVVVTCIEGELHPLWFYHWFRSQNGVEFIKSLTRGAVRERLLFNRLAKGEMTLPDWEAQLVFAEKCRSIKKARTALKAQLTSLDKLPAALIREAFGEVDTITETGQDGS